MSRGYLALGLLTIPPSTSPSSKPEDAPRRAVRLGAWEWERRARGVASRCREPPRLTASKRQRPTTTRKQVVPATGGSMETALSPGEPSDETADQALGRRPNAGKPVHHAHFHPTDFHVVSVCRWSEMSGRGRISTQASLSLNEQKTRSDAAGREATWTPGAC